jgi:hypothetical protein
VIYYSTQSRNAATIIHEGLHTYADPAFGPETGNELNEGVAEYFTRQILSDLNIPPAKNTYEAQLAEVNRIVPVIGEETLRNAYFKGEIDNFEKKVNQELGPCAFTEWLFAVQTRSDKAQQIIEDKSKPNYCKGNETSSAAPVAAPPAEEKPA